MPATRFGAGLRFDPAKLLIDPYAKAIDGGVADANTRRRNLARCEPRG
jgi:pullulanase/glycogen debranching enzyme